MDLSLGDALHAIAGKDWDALVSGATTACPMILEPLDIADLHVITGAIDNGADELCTNDSTTLGYDPIAPPSRQNAISLAGELGLIDLSASPIRVRPSRAP